MLADVRKYLESRIKMAMYQRDLLLKAENQSLVNDVTILMKPVSPDLAARIAVVDELVRVANFMDFSIVQITEETPDNQKLDVVSNLFLREYFEWVKEKKIPFSTLEDRLKTVDGVASTELAFSSVAVMAKIWYILNESRLIPSS